MNGNLPVPAEFDASGVFETCRVKGGRVLRLEEHLQRLQASLKTVGIPLTHTLSPEGRGQGEGLKRALQEAAKGLKEGYIRIAVRRRGHPRVLVHRQEKVPYSKKRASSGVVLRTVPSRWPAGETGWAQVKSSERLSGVLARMEAPEAAEVLRLGPHGYVTEGMVSNLFFVRQGTLVTAPAWLGVLEGVTRSRVIRSARKLRLAVREIPFSRHDLFNAEEAFLTNVLMGILPVRQVDGRRIGEKTPGPITRKLMKILDRYDVPRRLQVRRTEAGR
jgi:branched-chain amino acid aminotransferase